MKETEDHAHLRKLRSPDNVSLAGFLSAPVGYVCQPKDIYSTSRTPTKDVGGGR